METKAHYALVGFFAIALVVSAALFTVWLGQLQFDQEYNEYDVVFQGPPRGLTASGEVRFNGIPVGEVTRVFPDPQDASRVIARIRITAETPVMQDSVAQLEPQGLTGLSYIQINPGTALSQPLIAPSGEIPRLRSRPATLDSILASGESIADSATVAIARLNKLLSDKNIDEFSRLLENTRRLSDELAGEGEDALVARVRTTLDNLDQAARDVSTFAINTDALMNTEVAQMIEETTQASIEVNKASVDAQTFMAEIGPPAQGFANEGLNELTLAIDDLRRLLAELEAIAAGVEDNPAGFVSGPRRQEVEIPR